MMTEAEKAQLQGVNMEQMVAQATSEAQNTHIRQSNKAESTNEAEPAAPIKVNVASTPAPLATTQKPVTATPKASVKPTITSASDSPSSLATHTAEITQQAEQLAKMNEIAE